MSVSLWTKSYGVTIQIKPLRQFFCTVAFVFQYCTKYKLEFYMDFYFSHTFYFFIDFTIHYN